MKRVATDEDETVVSIPEVVRVAVVGIQPLLTIIITFEVEDVQVAIGVGYVQNAFHATTLRSLRDLRVESNLVSKIP